jgi:chemotaxis protein methyltransferase CheR
MTPFDDQQSLSALDFEWVRALVSEHASIVLDNSKTYLVIARLKPLAREHGFGSIGSLIAHLRSTALGELHELAVEAIATTETSFFRDLHPFNALRDEILPGLIEQKRDSTRTLSIWSAACSSGQEPHSIAMILRDRFSSLEGWNLQLIASDISRRMVDRAQEGLYSQVEVNRGLPAPYLIRFFTQEADQWRLRQDIRTMFRFYRQNLGDTWKIVAPVDILLMRNVLIYFDIETRRKILHRVRRILKPGGYLVLGAAETTLNFDQLFKRVPIGRAVFYQVDESTRGAGR